jgi:putative methyltransferase (TIGR04325 family)
MSAAKAFVRDWLPPAVTRWVRHFQRHERIQFEGEFSAWAEAKRQASGYDASDILDKVLAATLKVVRGEALFERDSVLFYEPDYVWPVLSGLLWVAARSGGVLNVLDFGGALGASYFQHRKFLEALPHCRWNIVEQSHYVAAGRKHIQNEILRFYESVDECLGETKPNVVLLSSVLQYLDEPRDVLASLLCLGASVVIIDRTPFSGAPEDRHVIQQVPPSIYPASYAMRIFSKLLFVSELDAEWQMLCSLPTPEGRAHTSTGFEFTFEGLWMVPKA